MTPLTGRRSFCPIPQCLRHVCRALLLGLIFSLVVAVGPAPAADATSGDGGVPLVAVAIIVLVTLAGIVVALGCLLSPLVRGPRERRVATPPAADCEGDAIEAELQWILHQAHARPSGPHASRSLD